MKFVSYFRNTSSVYDNFASNYDNFFSPFERWFMSNWREETFSNLTDYPRILEIGAGTGLNFRLYPKHLFAVASEISYKMLEFAKEKTNEIQLVQANAEILPFADNSFDAAVATLVICSVSNPEQVFVELQRVVKPSGKLILLEHVRPNGALGIIFDILNIFAVKLFEDHSNLQTSKIAKNSGLRILEVQRKAFGIVNLIVCEVIK